MDAPTVSAIAGSVSAFFAAISAFVNAYNTSTFRRQLKNTSIDACVAAGLGLKSLVHRTIELKGRNTDGEDIKDSEIFAAYEEAWTKWVLFAQAYQIARRYSSKLALMPQAKQHFVYLNCALFCVIPIGNKRQ